MRVVYLSASVTITDMVVDGSPSHVCHINEIASSGSDLEKRLETRIIEELSRYDLGYTENTRLYLRIDKMVVIPDRVRDKVDFEMELLVNDFIPFEEYVSSKLSRFFSN